MTEKRIFLDYAAATPVSNRALAAYVNATKFFANPQALHTEGLEAARVRDDARSKIAKCLEVKSSELIFTSGGTEANNLAVIGHINYLEEKGVDINDIHVVVSSIEHPSVNDIFQPQIKRGLKITSAEPDEHGQIRAESVREAIQENTVLVSIALVNSEIGVVQPIHAISKVLKEKNILLHIDACQGLYQSLIPKGLGVDLMSLDSGKMYGPRGVGVLYIAKDVKISPVLRGGSQENGLRPGTENVALYAGFAEALEECKELKDAESERLNSIREDLIKKLTERIEGIVINGDSKKQTPHILNISIPKIDSEYVSMFLDQRGLSLTTKSACLEREDKTYSHVVKALGGEVWRSKNTLRLSFGRDTNINQVDLIVEKIVEAVGTFQNFGK
ncbi:hypothetical protein COB52_02270 [Candidatus Kaiserbacteria bacterium]|nr:MAG: hypothetical protein COB52_02270 [Candidatus Kaiserbacteria bacterium]